MKVSWDDDIPNIWKNVPNHQPVYGSMFTEPWWFKGVSREASPEKNRAEESSEI